MTRKLFRWMMPLLAIALLISVGLWAMPSQAQQTTNLPIAYLGNADDDLAQGLQLAIDEINDAGGIAGPNNAVYALSLEVVALDEDNPDSVTDALDELPRVVAIFGPSDEALTADHLDALSGASAPVFLPARNLNVNAADTNDNIFQLIAPDITYAQSLARFLTFEVGASDIVLLQTPTENLNDGLNNFSAALNTFGTPPSQTLLVADDIQLANTIVNIANLDPEVVVAFGTPENAVLTLQQLREGGWEGLFVYPDARGIRDVEGFDPTLFDGVLSADHWSSSTPTSVGRTFVANYVAAFGDAPGALSVAGYDSIYALLFVIRDGDISPDALKAGVSQLRLPNLVGGPFSPGLYGNRILSQTVYIYAFNNRGGADTLTVYDNGVRRDGLDVESPVIGDPAIAASATPTLAPTATTLPATPTPSFLTATVNSNVGALNVREGPDTIYTEIDELRPGEQVIVVGRNNDYSWLFVQYEGRTGWIFTEFVTVFDPGNLYGVLPIVPSPATPTPQPTTGPVNPDLIITNVSLNPAQPQPSSPISATVTIQNQGSTDAGQFAVATSFRPGEVYTAQVVNSLPAGQTVNIVLTNTVVNTGYVPDLGFVVDLNNEVNEGTNGEGNNTFTIAYKVDRSLAIESSATLNAGQSINFFGANVDLSWDGNAFNMPGNARIGVLNGVDYVTSHYDQVAPAAVNTQAVSPQPGTIFAILTDEGNAGILRVDNRNGSQVTITYRIYN